MKKELVSISKFLSKVLRHDPDSIAIVLDKNGWTDVDQLIKNANIFGKFSESITRALLDEIVDTNEKKRFEYSEDGWNIRARQGHSQKVDLGYPVKDPPKNLYHGTAQKYVPSIRKGGIDARKRHHVHLSEDLATATKVGQRHGKPYVLTIDCEKMANDGYEFFQTDNNVWLVDAVPAKYIDFDKNYKPVTKS